MALKAGIDLGTTNSCIYVLIGDEIVVVRDKNGNPTVPSAVWKHKGEVRIGRPARAFAGRTPAPVLEVKRLMGTDKTVMLDGEPATPVQVSAMILKFLKDAGESYVRANYPQHADSITDVIVTHPAYFGAAARAATAAAGEQAGFKKVVLLPEPIAAALAYARRLSAGGDAGERRILAYDLGGGTFDVTVLERKADGEIDVLEYGGDPWLGGANFDLCVADHLRRQLVDRGYKLADLDPSAPDDSIRITRLKHEAEAIKIELTGRDPVERAMPDFMQDRDGESVDLSATISRQDFDSWTKSLIDRSIQLTHRTLARQSFADRQRRTDEELDRLSDMEIVARSRANAQHCDIIMVGSSCWMPVVKRRLEDELGRPCQLVSPDVIVAEGAAIKAKGIGDEGATLATSDPRVQVALAHPRLTNRTGRVPIKGELLGDPVPCSVVLTDVETGQQDQRAIDVKRTFLFQRSLRTNQANEFTLRVQRREDDQDILEHAFIVIHDAAWQPPPPTRESLSIPILIETQQGFETLFAANAEFPIKRDHPLRTPDDSGQLRVPFYEGDAYQDEILITKAPKRKGVPFVIRAVMTNSYTVTAEAVLEDIEETPSITFRVDRARRVRSEDEIERELDTLRMKLNDRVEAIVDATQRMRFRVRQERLEREIQREAESLRPEPARTEELLAQYQKLFVEAGQVPRLTPPYDELVSELAERRPFAPNQGEITTLNALLQDARRAWDSQDVDKYDPAVRACRELTKSWKRHEPEVPPPPPPTPAELKQSDLTSIEYVRDQVEAWPSGGTRDTLLSDLSIAEEKMRNAPDETVFAIHNKTLVPIFRRFKAGPDIGPKPPDPYADARPALPDTYELA